MRIKSLKKSDSGPKTRAKTLKLIFALAIIAGSAIYAIKSWWPYWRGLSAKRPENSGEAVSPESRSNGSISGADTEEVSLNTIIREMKPLPFENFEDNRKEAVEYLDLSARQQIQLLGVWRGFQPQDPEDLQNRLRETREYLSPPQREKLHTLVTERFHARIAERQEIARRTLPPDQYKIFQKRLDERAGEIEKWIEEAEKEIDQ